MKDAPYGVKDAREGDVDGWKDSMDLSAIQVTVRACLAEEDCGTAQGATCAGVYAEQLLQALQDGLVGNRSVPAGSVWAVVQAMEKAFPVLMSPAVDAVRASESGLYPTSESLALLWVQKASEDGSLPFFISKVRTQPQVYTAYLKTASLRDRALSTELEAAVASLKGKVKFPQPPAPKDSSVAGEAQLGAAAEIECRDAAPQAAADVRPAQSSSAVAAHRPGPGDAAPAAADSEPPEEAASSENAPTGRQHGAAAMLLGTGSGLSNLWEKHWSHTDITRPPDHSKQACEKASRRSLDEGSTVASASDAGHLNTVSQQLAPEATDVCVVLHLSVLENASDSVSTQQPGTVRVRLEVKVPGSAAERKSNAGPGEPALTKAVGFAPVARLATLGGFIRSQSWRGAAQTSEPTSMAGASPELAMTGDMQSSAAVLLRGSGAVAADSSNTSVQCPAVDASSQQGTKEERKITVEIRVGGQIGGDENSGHSCRLVLSMPTTDVHSHAAGDPPSSQRGSRLNSLSGLFRASKPLHDVLAIKPKEFSQVVCDTGSTTAEPAQARMPSSSGTEQQQVTASSSSAGLAQKRARWAVPGSAAVSSLYGLVQHAAEVPLAHAGRAVVSLPGMRSHAAAQPINTDRAADADMTADIVMRIKTAASAILEVGMGEGIVLGQDMVEADVLCGSIEELLRHGIRPCTPRDAWTSYLATHRDAPLDMLQEASRLAPGAEAKGWGLEGARAAGTAGSHAGAGALQMWIRSGLNEQALGARLHAICSCQHLLESWYSESATLRQEEASGQIMGLLLGLDAVRFLLLVDPPRGSPGAPGGLMGGLRHYLPQPWARQGHAHDGVASAQQPHQEKHASARRRSRAAAIQDATEGPRPQPEGPQKEAPVGDPSELLTPLSNLPLSPLSSMGLDLSAEPLSPTTTAALQILRERGFPQAANSAGFVADEAGRQDSGSGADAHSELPSVLDNILAAPDIGLLAPEHMRAAMPLDDDDPPPWQPLRIPHAVDMSAASHGRSSAPAASAGASSGARSGPKAAATGSFQHGGGMQSSQREVEQSTREQRRREVTHKAKPGALSRHSESPLAGADSLEAPSSASMQAARSQEGDFFRLLDSAGPAPRASFQESDLEQLPRSFSTGPKAKAPALKEPADESSEAEEERSRNVTRQQEATLRSSAAGALSQAADLANMPALVRGAAELPQAIEQHRGFPDTQPVTDPVGKHAEAFFNAHSNAHPSKELQRLQAGTTAGDTNIVTGEVSTRDVHPQDTPSATNTEATAPTPRNENSLSGADGSMPSQLQGSQHDASPPHDHSAVPGLMGGAASSDLTYTQLTALLGNNDAQDDEFSELDALSPPSTSRTESDDMASTDAEGLVARAEAAVAAVAKASEQLDHPFSAEAHLDQALDAAQADVMLPEQQDSAAGDADLAATLEHARDEQRLEQISQQHAVRDLESNMERLAVLTGRQGGPMSDAEHDANMQRLAKLTGEAGGSSKSRTPHEEQAAHETPDIVRQLLAGASAAPEHGMDSSIASEPDVAHLLLEAAREANADLARDAETDANMLEDMSEVLMLDLGGNSGYAAGLTSPRDAARFSFNEHSSHAASAGASDASWQIAEARVVSAATKEEAGSEYTLYSVEVTPADAGEPWMVQRRFKDFMGLRAALTALMGLGNLPSCWNDVSKARSVTGRHRLAPEVVAARQAMLDRCLVSVVQGPAPFNQAAPLLAFLAPPESHWQAYTHGGSGPGRQAARSQAGGEGTHPPGSGSSASSSRDTGPQYGSLVRLLTEQPPKLSEADLIRLQRGACAACRNPLPPPVKQSGFLGSRNAHLGPRRCEYNGRLYCHECHRGDLAELPARVLHHWDFNPQPVSAMAADYLSSISDRPLLCIGAVNPGLYARVPLLARAQDQRQRACKALAAARASGAEGSQKARRLLGAAGPRRYLLESPDFWAMRELRELSKGAFSQLPAWLETVAQKAAQLATSALLDAAQEQQQTKGQHYGRMRK